MSDTQDLIKQEMRIKLHCTSDITYSKHLLGRDNVWNVKFN